MQIILHRRNSIEELASTPEEYGVEIDIRSYGNQLILSHDPYIKGESFETWIEFYKHGTLILNTKEEGLEERILEIMKANSINSFFFLDQSFPFLIKTSDSGESRSAIRVSEYESISTALSLRGKIEWAWIDYFSKFPLNKENISTLKEAKFKTCIVSPELEGYSKDEVNELCELLSKQNISIDAVCTKYPKLWEEYNSYL